MDCAHGSIAAGAALVELIVKEADNNVKLIVLDRFDTLREKHPHVLDNLTMDILKVLSRCVRRVLAGMSADPLQPRHGGQA